MGNLHNAAMLIKQAAEKDTYSRMEAAKTYGLGSAALGAINGAARGGLGGAAAGALAGGVVGGTFGAVIGKGIKKKPTVLGTAHSFGKRESSISAAAGALAGGLAGRGLGASVIIPASLGGAALGASIGYMSGAVRGGLGKATEKVLDAGAEKAKQYELRKRASEALSLYTNYAQ